MYKRNNIQTIYSFKALFAFILICISLCGCVKTPDNLQNRETAPQTQAAAPANPASQENNSTAENPPQVQTAPVERGNMEVIRNQIPSDLQKTYKNISINYARVSESESMPTYGIEIGMNPDFEFEILLKRLYGERLDVTDERYYRYHKTGEAINKEFPPYTEPVYSDDGENILLRNIYDMDITTFSPDYDKDPTFSTITYSTGNIFGSQCGGGLGNGNDWYSYTGRDICKQYYLKTEQPAADEAYTMVDGKEWNALEAIEFVESFWKDYITPSDTYNFIYSVKALYVVEIDDSHFAYLFEMQKQDEAGNYYDVDKAEFYFINKEVLEGMPFPYTNRLVTYCAEKESISRFGKDFSFKLTDKRGDGDSLLTLGAASDLLSEALAPNISLNLTAELNYMVICNGYNSADSWIKKEFYSDLCLQESDFEIRPYWCFKPVGQCFLLNELAAERYYVDAVTGEVSTTTYGRYQKPER